MKTSHEKIQYNRILENRASVCESEATETVCPACDELLVFAMRDAQHEFSIGLITILECVALAEKRGHVPRLPQEWWNQLCTRFPTLARAYQHIFYLE